MSSPALLITKNLAVILLNLCLFQKTSQILLKITLNHVFISFNCKFNFTSNVYFKLQVFRLLSIRVHVLVILEIFFLFKKFLLPLFLSFSPYFCLEFLDIVR